MIKPFICFLIAALLWTTLAAQPTPANWRVWLHDGQGHLVMVDHRGRVRNEIWLLLPENLSTVGTLAFSPDGRRVTFNASDGQQQRYQRFILDTREGTLLNLPAPDDPSLAPVEQAAFDEAGRLLAYSEAGWVVLVADTVTGEVRQRIDPSTPDLPPSIQPEAPFTPIVQRFSDRSVWFSVMPDGTTLHPVSYRWDLITGTVSETHAYAETPARTFTPTGEVAAVAEGTSSVVIYEPLSRAVFTFYHNPALEIEDDGVWFVENGKRLLVHARRSAAEQEAVWLLLARDGTLVRPLRDINRRTIHGTVDGFVYVLAQDGISELIHNETARPFSDRSVWQAEGQWDIVWVDSGAESYGPYLPWRVSSEITLDPSNERGLLAPTPVPTGLPLLVPNMEVYVNTNGDVLYLRDAPGLDSTILQYLYDRDMVTLLEGPVARDGYRWWRVRTEDGAEGWAAEVSDDVTTLLPEPPPRITPGR